jgi:polyisoprenyl-teichoic acid--peptidoglycan teichoic acid transferase
MTATRPTPARPGPSDGAGGPDPATGSPGRSRRRAARRLVALLTTLALVGGGGGVVLGVVLGRVVPAQAQEPAFTLTATGDADFTGAPDQPVFFLMIGNDERPGVGGRRADALHVVGINPAAGQATILNIPRDTWVDYPDGGGAHRINEGTPRGGPELQARLVSDLVGVPISFTIEVNFAGFVGLIDELGGIDLWVPQGMSDRNSGAAFDPGPQHLSGEQALAFSRNRHIGGGDFTRTRNQASVLIAALAAARTQVTGPTSALQAMSTFFRYGEFVGADWDDLFRLGEVALTIDPSTIRSQLVPGRSGNAGGASVVFVDPGAALLFEDFRDDAILSVYPPDPPL